MSEPVKIDVSGFGNLVEDPGKKWDDCSFVKKAGPIEIKGFFNCNHRLCMRCMRCYSCVDLSAYEVGDHQLNVTTKCGHIRVTRLVVTPHHAEVTYAPV